MKMNINYFTLGLRFVANVVITAVFLLNESCKED